MKSPRVNVCLEPIELELIQILSKKRKISMSSMIKKMVEDWLDDYEDLKTVEKIEKRLQENNGTISHEEFWKDLV